MNTSIFARRKQIIYMSVSLLHWHVSAMLLKATMSDPSCCCIFKTSFTASYLHELIYDQFSVSHGSIMYNNTPLTSERHPVLFAAVVKQGNNAELYIEQCASVHFICSYYVLYM